MSTPILRLENVSKSFQGVKVISDINIEIYPGKVTALIGANGAGKTTLIKLISGIYPASEGSFYYCGELVNIKTTYDAIKLGIVSCPQELQLFYELSVFGNICMGNEIFERNKIFKIKEMEKTVTEVLKKLNLNIDIHRKVKHLSLAEKFLVQFARAILRNPKIIIIDELIDVLTQVEYETVYAIIKELNRMDVAVIFISHRIDETIKIADNILVLRDGKIIESIDTKVADEENIKKLIIGNDIKDHYPKLKVKKGEELLRVSNIKSRFLDNISFSLCRGEILGIVGLAGSGRTSLLKAIVGIDRIDQGEIVFFSNKKIHKRNKFMDSIGFMSEYRDIHSFFPSLSIGRNITIKNLNKVKKFKVINNKLENMRSKDALDRIGLNCNIYNGNISHLSGGSKQKVLIARNVFSKCNIYVFDEPTKGIDIAGKVEVYNIINELLRRGAGIILVSSDFMELSGMCDKVIVINKGKMTGELERDEFTQSMLYEMLNNY